jgi:small conductance mechanosensitive channel
VIQATLEEFTEIVKDPSPQVGIQEFADSSINIGFRYWIPSRKYFETLYAVNLAIFFRFNQNGIDIPFPQRVVHMAGKTS